MTPKELIDWYTANRNALPREEFMLAGYIKVSDPTTFYTSIDTDLKTYPEVKGRKRLISHLQMLYDFVNKQQ